MLRFELREAVRQARLVDRHLARHEDEAVEQHPLAEDGYELEGLLEDDVKVAVHLRGVGVAGPPEIEPVGVYLRSVSSRGSTCMRGGVPGGSRS